MRNLFLLLCFYSSALFAQQNTAISTAQQQHSNAPITIGDEFPLQLETSHPYAQTGQQGVVFEQEFYNKNSAYIKLYFEDFDLGPEDYIEISTHNTGESIIYGGKGKIIDENGTMISNFWSQALLDEGVTVRLHAVGGQYNNQGFKIARVAYGYSEARIEALAVAGKAICGSDDKERIACYSGTTMFNKGKAVCRLLINGSGLCTGWLLGCEGHLMTNNHCIGTASDAANTDFMFNYQYSSCSGTANASSSVVASSATFLKTNPFSSTGLDYTLVKLPVNPTATYGYLSLSSTPPSVGDRIYIVQHPGGRRKEISVNTDQGGTADGFSAVNTITTNGIRYFADTEGGSSGSPVLSYASNLVYAIHNTGGCQNGSYGRCDKLIADIGSLMPNCGVDDINNGGGGNTGGCTNAISSFPYNESFNGSLGAWTQNSDDNTNWTVRTGSTPSSSTGPTSAFDGSHYIYVESSSPQYPSKSAILTSPCFNMSSLNSSSSITFQYHLYGASMGSVSLQASTNGGSSWSTLWTQSGDQGNSWKSASVSVGSLAGNSSVQLRFNGITGSSWQSDMAIDKFAIGGGSGSGCYSSFPYTQNFENNITGWTQSSSDDFNWELRSGSTPSSSTGPASADQGSYYIYMESSAPNYSTKQAILTSQCFDLSGMASATLSFRYHLYGATSMGNLKLEANGGSGWVTIWSRSGNQGNSWQTAAVNLSSYLNSSNVSFRLNGTTGTTWQGDMAVDAFTISGTAEAATVESISETPFLTVSPNPFNTHLNINTNLEGSMQYRLVNVQGQVVQEGVLQGNHLEVGNLARGVYFITFYNAEEQIVRKLIKQ